MKHTIKCDIKDFGDCLNILATIERQEGDEFGEFWHCPECMWKIRNNEEEEEEVENYI